MSDKGSFLRANRAWPHPDHMLEMLGVPQWLAVVPPMAAVLCVALWWKRPELRRKEGYRLALIASVSLTALETLLAALFLFIFVLFLRSGGMENF